MKNAPKLEGIVNFSKNDFFMVEINGKYYPFSKYTSKRFVRPKKRVHVNCFFNDSNKMYIERVESKREDLIYELKK